MTEFTTANTELIATFGRQAHRADVPMSLDDGRQFMESLPDAVPDSDGDWWFRDAAGTDHAFVSASDADDQTAGIECQICDEFANPGPEDTVRLDAVFADTVQQVSDILGEPSTKNRAEFPRVSWTRGNGARVTVRRNSAVVPQLESPGSIRLDKATL